MTDFTLTDFNGRAITVGTRVCMWDDESDRGVVTDLGEWDVDYSDKLERPVGFPPRVTVSWDGAGIEKFDTSEWDAHHERGKVEELDVINEEE